MYWNDKKIGKTAHIEGTLDPIWDLEIFFVKIDQDGPNSIEESTLRIVCLDWDQFGGDDVLGQIELTGQQIKQLTQSKDGDEVVTASEGAMGEADMEKVFDFIRMLQEHEMDPAGLGEMIVGVPRDPDIQKHHQDHQDQQAQIGEAAQVESRKKTKRKKKRKHGGGEGDEATKKGADRGEEKVVVEEAITKTQLQENGATGLSADPTSSKDGVQLGREEKGQEAGEADPIGEHKAEAAVVLVQGIDREGHAGGMGCQGEVDQTAEANEEVGRPCDQRRLSEVGAESTQGKNEECGDVSASGEERKTVSHDSNINLNILKIDPLTAEAGGMEGGQRLSSGALPEGKNVLEYRPNREEELVQNAAAPENAPGAQPSAVVEEGGTQRNSAEACLSCLNVDVRETKAGSIEDGRPPWSEEPLESEVLFESGVNREGQSAPHVAPENISKEAPDADIEEGGAQVDIVSAPAEQQAEKRGKTKVRNSVQLGYRDGKEFIVLESTL